MAWFIYSDPERNLRLLWLLCSFVFCFKKGSYIALAILEHIQISVCLRLLKLKEPPPPVITFIVLCCFIEIGFHCVCGDGLRLGSF